MAAGCDARGKCAMRGDLNDECREAFASFAPLALPLSDQKHLPFMHVLQSGYIK